MRIGKNFHLDPYRCRESMRSEWPRIRVTSHIDISLRVMLSQSDSHPTQKSYFEAGTMTMFRKVNPV